MERALRRQRDEHKLAGFTQVIANPNPNPNPSPSPSPNPDPNPNPNQVSADGADELLEALSLP